jgi:hypothetical protein
VRDSTYKSGEAVKVDAIVSTIGFNLVGGPAGSVRDVFCLFLCNLAFTVCAISCT